MYTPPYFLIKKKPIDLKIYPELTFLKIRIPFLKNVFSLTLFFKILSYSLNYLSLSLRNVLFSPSLSLSKMHSTLLITPRLVLS